MAANGDECSMMPGAELQLGQGSWYSEGVNASSDEKDPTRPQNACPQRNPSLTAFWSLTQPFTPDLVSPRATMLRCRYDSQLPKPENTQIPDPQPRRESFFFSESRRA